MKRIIERIPKKVTDGDLMATVRKMKFAPQHSLAINLQCIKFCWFSPKIVLDIDCLKNKGDTSLDEPFNMAVTLAYFFFTLIIPVGLF